MTASNYPSLLQSCARTSTISMALPSSIVSCGLTTNKNTDKRNSSNALLGWCASSHNLNVISSGVEKGNTISSYSCRPGSSLVHVDVDSTSNIVWTLQSDNVLTCWRHNQKDVTEISGPNDEKNAHLFHTHSFLKEKYHSWKSPVTTTITVNDEQRPFWISFANLHSAGKKTKNGFEIVVATPAKQQDQILSFKHKNRSQALFVETIPVNLPGFKFLNDKILNSWVTVVSEESTIGNKSSINRKRKFIEKERKNIVIQLQFVVLKDGKKLQYCSYTVRQLSSTASDKTERKNNAWTSENIFVKNIQLPAHDDDNDNSTAESLLSLQVEKWNKKRIFAFVYPLLSKKNDDSDDNSNSPDSCFQCSLMNIPTHLKSTNGKKLNLELDQHLLLSKPTSSCQLQSVETLSNFLLVVHWCDNDGGESIIDLYHTQRCLLLDRNHYYNDSKVAFCKTNGSTNLAIMQSTKVILTNLFATTAPASNKFSLAQSMTYMKTSLMQPQLTRENNLQHLWNKKRPDPVSQEYLKQQKVVIQAFQKHRDIHSQKTFNFWEVFTTSIQKLTKYGINGSKLLSDVATDNNGSNKKVTTHAASFNVVLGKFVCEEVPSVLFETAISVSMDVMLSCEIECRRLKQESLQNGVNSDEEDANMKVPTPLESFRIQQSQASRVFTECLELKELSARVHIMAELSRRHNFKQNGPLLALFLSLRNLSNFKWSKNRQDSEHQGKTPIEMIRSIILHCPNLTEHMIVAMIRYVICYSDGAELYEDMLKHRSWYERYSKTFNIELKFEESDNKTLRNKSLSRCKLFWTFAILCLRKKETSTSNPALLRSAFLHQRMCKIEVMTWLQLLSNILKRAVSASSVTIEYPGSTKHVIQLISALMDAHIGQLLQPSNILKPETDDVDESELTQDMVEVENEMKAIKKEVQKSISVARLQAEVVLGLENLLQNVEAHLNETNVAKPTDRVDPLTLAQITENKTDTIQTFKKGVYDKLFANDPIPIYSLERLVF